MTSALEPRRPRRADARANRERVIRAAAEVLAERGPQAGVDEIAARAGVGKATVYRSFPTKEHLLAAVFCQWILWLADRAREGAQEEDAWTALVDLVTHAFEQHATNRAFTADLSTVRNRPEVEAAGAELDAALDVLVERGKRQGVIRADATSRDVRVLVGGVGGLLAAQDTADVEIWRRYALLVAHALRP